ncbi:uncharacterized protein UBRO2_01136 [Ustilago bromivora]|uniref:Uncharacterized protein n=1 Tax=Ustilago bromivora TaxID=307758 RepID=A0A8H8TQV9_9BASI|nr:uncharacterized protein UBRO2_01136 [Ustilago bromivora]
MSDSNQNNKGEEQSFTIQPHPATTNDPNTDPALNSGLNEGVFGGGKPGPAVVNTEQLGQSLTSPSLFALTLVTMLHSNTDASSFRLQPAPRPKKRPQNPPSIQRRPSRQPRPLLASDASSLRSGFDDDQELCLTPKASYSNLPLLASPKAGGGAKHDENRPRSSTISNHSASSTSSVSRLLAAISLPLSPRPSKPQSPSVRETLMGMLTNKSPSPSSPLFPRNTLMSSLSSTCISPTSPSGGGALRKRMGWRAALSAPKQHETAILMSPESPLTPRRADTLHTPTQASISSILHANHLQVDQENQSEPLSATLKALGAKRQTQPFPPNTNVLPVNEAEEAKEAEEAFESPRTVKSPPYFESDLESSRESFQLLTAQRKIFHLPTWIRFEANHHARTQIVQNNRTAAEEFSSLVETMPKTSHLGDVAPDSPNGELFAGFDINPAPDTKQEQHVVKVVKTPTMATLRNSGNGGGALIAAIIINVIVLSHSTSASKPRKANVDPMTNAGLAYIPTTTNRSMGARESNIAKAAQLSQP